MNWTTEQLKDHPRRDSLTGTKMPPSVPLPEQFQLHNEQSENELQETIEGLLKRAGVAYQRSRMDKPTTQTLGAPDFTVCLPTGKYLGIECKVGTNKLTDDQASFSNTVLANDGLFMVVNDAETVRKLLNAYKG